MNLRKTRASLLIRVRNPADTQAWTEFHALYSPLLYQYARARGLGEQDAEDVRSACYEVLIRQLPHFNYDQQKGGFKAWLRVLAERRVYDLLRKRKDVLATPEKLAAIPDNGPETAQLWETHWEEQQLRYAMRKAKDLVTAETYEVFRQLVEEHRTVPQVCQALNLNANQVYKAKARVLTQIREIIELL